MRPARSPAIATDMSGSVPLSLESSRMAPKVKEKSEKVSYTL